MKGVRSKIRKGAKEARLKVRGVIGSAPLHILKKEELERPLKLEEMFIDIGASSRAEAEERGIKIGGPVVIHYPCERLK